MAKYKQFKLSLSPEEHARIMAASKESGRTFSGEIMVRVRASFAAEGTEALIGRALAQYEASRQTKQVSLQDYAWMGLLGHNYQRGHLAYAGG